MKKIIHNVLVHAAIASAALMVIVMSSAFSQTETHIDSVLAQCLGINQSTQGMIECIREAQNQYDGELNTAYNALMKQLSPELKQALKTAQRAWIAFRDKESEASEKIFWAMEGTMYHIMAADHMMALVKNRTLELQSLLETWNEAKGE